MARIGPPPKFSESIAGESDQGQGTDVAGDTSAVKDEPEEEAPSAPKAERDTALAPATEDVVRSSDVEHKISVVETKPASPASSPASRYQEPAWAGVPKEIPYEMEVIKGGVPIQNIPLSQKSFYMFGRQPDCDVVLDHPSCSRYHAVVQYRQDGAAFIYDNGSTHGTMINKKLLKAAVHAPLRVGDVIKFGQSSRLHIFQGPAEFMPKEGLSRQERQQIHALEAADNRLREEQLRQATVKTEATWGMDDGPVPQDKGFEEEVDTDWRTKYQKGELTDKQTLIAERIFKKERTMANLKSEMERITAKEVHQQGLTEGQQAQIARNTNRFLDLQNEIDEAEDVLLDSVAEAQHGKDGRKRKARMEEDNDAFNSDDDEFYDRTNSKKKKQENYEEAETVESLWLKMHELTKEKESILSVLNEKVNEIQQQISMSDKNVDSLDSYINSVKSQVQQEQILELQKKLLEIQNKIQKIERLITIADPSNLYMSITGGRRNYETIAELRKINQNNQLEAKTSKLPKAIISSPPKFESAQSEEQKVDADQSNVPKTVADEDGFIDRAAFVAASANSTPMTKVGPLEFMNRPTSSGATSTDAEAKIRKKGEVEAEILREIDVLIGAHRMETSDPGMQTSESWLPPSGQTGDGKTNINKKLGY